MRLLIKPALCRAQFAFAAVFVAVDVAPPAWGEEPAEPIKHALEQLKLPGVKIDVEKRCVDVDATVCLEEGMLELVACAVDSKEHESIVAVNARPMHIHTALLLLGAKAGMPAIRERIEDEDGGRWIDVPPRGGGVAVSLSFANAAGQVVERPIGDFIKHPAAADEADAAGFPTSTFLFAGSQLREDGSGGRRYLADASGNVVSISTFGDELLCLPGTHSHAKGELMWAINPTHLPAVGSKVTLRLRPVAKPAPHKGKTSPSE